MGGWVSRSLFNCLDTTKEQDVKSEARAAFILVNDKCRTKSEVSMVSLIR